MARTLTLTKRLENLINSIGGSSQPKLADIKSSLMTLLGSAQALEDGQATAEAEAKISALEAELDNLKAELSAADTAMDQFRKEQAEREEAEKYPNLPKEQFWILEMLPIESKGGITVSELADRVDLPVSEVELHLDKLHTLTTRLVHHTHGQPISRRWFCTIDGTKYLMAMRAGGEYLKFERSARLDDSTDQFLRILSRNPGGLTTLDFDCAVRGASNSYSMQRVTDRLKAMKPLVAFTGNKWIVAEAGVKYLSEYRGSRAE